VIGERQDIDWAGERAEREAKAAEREANRRAEQKRRTQRKMQEMLERQSDRTDASADEEETSMLETTTKNIADKGVLATNVGSKENSFLDGFMSTVAVTVMSAIIPTAQAQEAVDWINLATTEAGVHEITYEQLVDDVDLAGLAIDQISLVNQGQVVPVQILGDAVFGPGSTIRFVATAIDTLYTDRNIYTLRSGGEAAVQISSESTPISNRTPFATSYLASAKFAPQLNYSFTSPDESDPWYAKRMLSLGEPVSETMELVLKQK